MKNTHPFSWCRCNIIIMAIAVATFCGCSESDPAGALPGVKVKMEPGKCYARVVIPAGQSADHPEGQGFLPFPGNWSNVYDGDVQVKPALHAMVISDALASGSTLEIKPVALLQVDSAGIARDIVIAVPVDTALRTMQIDGFVDLLTEHEPTRHILQTWIINHRGFGSFELTGWRDENAALKRIQRQ